MTRSTITLRFYAELNDFLPKHLRHRAYTRRVFLSPPVKGVIESEGVPHTEVDLVLADGQSVGFDYRLRIGARVAVYPVFEALEIGDVQRLRPQPLRQPCFILDVHLGTLARYLRILGFDCLYRNDYTDHQIVATAVAEHRIVLTRDIGLLEHAAVTHGYWVRHQRPDAQVREILARFDLYRRIAPFTRCTRCNGLVEPVERSGVADRVPPGAFAANERFYACRSCAQVYWEGSHYHALMDRIRSWVETADRCSGENEMPTPFPRDVAPGCMPSDWPSRSER